MFDDKIPVPVIQGLTLGIKYFRPYDKIGTLNLKSSDFDYNYNHDIDLDVEIITKHIFENGEEYEKFIILNK
jgi:hypothetical protein